MRVGIRRGIGTDVGSSFLVLRSSGLGLRSQARFVLYNRGVSLPLFFALYCIEAGLFFLIAPWTHLWTFNPLFRSSPDLALAAVNPFVRGFVSGFGLMHIIIGISDLLRIGGARRAAGE